MIPRFPTFGEMTSLALVLLISASLVAGYFGSVHRALDSFSHLRVHLAFLLILAALPLFATRFLKVGAVAAFAALLAIASASGSVPIAGLGMAYGPLYPRNDDVPNYRVLQLNLRFDNMETGKVLSLIGRVKPDVLTLDEVSESWAQRLQIIRSAYPHGILCPFPDGRDGVALLSRRPLAQDAKAFCDERGALAMAAVDFGGRTIEVASLHLGWPWPYEQAWQIGGLSRFFADLGETAILAGDFNAAPWSYAIKRVADAGKLTLMPSPGSTWLERHLPRFMVFAGLPIDQVMAKGDVLVHSIAALEDVGSDHLPVLIEFSLKPKPIGPESRAFAETDSGSSETIRSIER